MHATNIRVRWVVGFEIEITGSNFSKIIAKFVLRLVRPFLATVKF